MPRYPIPPMPAGPGGTVPQRRDGIADLIYEQGRIRADAAARSGDMWANTIAGIGQNIGGVIAQREGQKQLRKRDAAWVDYVESGEWQKDPKQAYGIARRIWGPDADKQMAGLESVQKLSAAMQGKPLDPAEAKKSLGSIVRAIKPMGNEAWERWWPTLSKLAQTALPGAELPPQFDPSQRAEYEAIGESLLGEKPAGRKTAVVGDALVDEATGEVVYKGEAKPGKKYEVEVAGPGGTKIKKLVTEEELAAGVQQYVPPRESKDPKLVQVETVDENGKPVTKFVTPTAGASFAKPTGAGKASTGQQKRALNFFNRAKEAAEIVDSLETGKKLSPTALKYVPDAANFLLSDENQAYRQAQRAFTEARLRKESGAAIKDEEYESDALKYFNQPGDSEATKAQKRAGRNAVLAGIAFESGDALKEFYGDEAEGLLTGLKESGGGGLQPMTSRDFSVKAPDGKTYRFKSAAELDGFKKRAGIR